MTTAERRRVAEFLRAQAPTQTHAMRRAFQDVADHVEREMDETRYDYWQWAELLIQRDGEEGRKVLERMLDYYQENDDRAADFGRLHIVIDARKALGHE